MPADADRRLLEAPAHVVAPLLLGAVLTHVTPDGAVAVRLTEVEAYEGEGQDPGSHAHRGRTPRTAVMFGDPGHLYTYFTYGMHTCANITCLPSGRASAVLLRAGEVVAGEALAQRRRTTAKRAAELARGPARLVVALGIVLADGGSDVLTPPFGLRLAPVAPEAVSAGPRVGVSGEGGDGDRFPWRFWITGDPTVSPYRPGKARLRSG
ncbi:DNA-3-methyladenine glycosylase [uncultured Amnibacterium sp.]|uniref:DNA-3-methyladenine glycosylase n=1 Tax=uncultured Amnibacterium sp. TaxID=1631851 RepID=UPI0035C95ACA